jgi:hypothetical protein
MRKRKGPKTLLQVRAATLADVKRVMAKPRVASSAGLGSKKRVMASFQKTSVCGQGNRRISASPIQALAGHADEGILAG